MRTPAYIIALSAAVSVVSASNFIECGNALLQTNLLAGLTNLVGTLLGATTTLDQCNAYCQGTAGTNYAYYQPGVLTLLANCYCTNTPPGTLFILGASNSAGSCSIGGLGLPAYYTISYTGPFSSQYSPTACVTSATLGGQTTAVTTTNDPAQCFAACKDYPYMVITPQSAGANTLQCQCGVTLQSGGTTACAAGVPEIFANNAATISALARRRARLAREAKAQQPLTYCPSPLEACTIPGTSGWECINTQTELESCGGCIGASFNNPNATTGVDCTRLPGVRSDSVECTKGRCVASRCARGYDLKDGLCAPRS